ncbi:MAG: hypothetical protein IT223_07275 [Crocinitomicaceae bacterium]|nr:hypothetical protein [Crocinitomicaceae bacterium]
MSNAGIYNVTATVNGCVSAAGSTTAVINSTPSSSFTPVTAVATISQLFAPAVSGAVYSWTFTSGSPANSADETPSVTWSTAGSYNVSLSVTANGCSSSTTNQVTVSTPIIQTFSYSGGEQTFTVPGGVTSLIVQCWGAEGGNSGAQAGKGGYASGTLSVSPGNTLYLYVGGQGTTVGNSSIGGGGFNGGGNANGSSGGGGGASDVRFGGNSLGNRMIVAGGGGGGGYSGSGGGAGGGLTGSDGANGTAGTPGGGGQGGSQSSGGNGGSPGSGGAGNIGQGGQGGNVAGIGYSGGGGGGYYGGGGGGGEISWGNGGGGSGGGGSSYIGGVTNGSTTSNVWSGNGQIKIIYF